MNFFTLLFWDVVMATEIPHILLREQMPDRGNYLITRDDEYTLSWQEKYCQHTIKMDPDYEADLGSDFCKKMCTAHWSIASTCPNAGADEYGDILVACVQLDWYPICRNGDDRFRTFEVKVRPGINTFEHLRQGWPTIKGIYEGDPTSEMVDLPTWLERAAGRYHSLRQERHERLASIDVF